MADDKPCQLWIGSVRKDGYGYLHVNGVYTLAHRYVYEQATGESPEEVHHKCLNHGCVEITHLEGLTCAEHKQRHLKTHCKHGHPYGPESTYIDPTTGARSCKTCRRYRNRKQKING
jgi:hypothetical protein